MTDAGDHFIYFLNPSGTGRDIGSPHVRALREASSSCPPPPPDPLPSALPSVPLPGYIIGGGVGSREQKLLILALPKEPPRRVPYSPASLIFFPFTSEMPLMLSRTFMLECATDSTVLNPPSKSFVISVWPMPWDWRVGRRARRGNFNLLLVKS